MTTGIVDTTVIFHYYRRNLRAREWVSASSERLSITPITWLEVMRGAPGRTGQIAAKAILDLFEMEYLTPSDMDWAMQQMEAYRLSRGVEANDCLIASACYRLNVPIYTHNRKDFLKLLPARLVITPY